ncbi:hypothetical protein DVK06_16450 [Halorubrum sp. Atlit-28R]|nr:hypothetical protein DVK06_16450 [Halorubrum sp. Atlit-28R]
MNVKDRHILINRLTRSKLEVSPITSIIDRIQVIIQCLHIEDVDFTTSVNIFIQPVAIWILRWVASSGDIAWTRGTFIDDFEFFCD